MNVEGVLGAGLFLIVGIGLAAYGGYDYTQAQDDVESAIEAEGTIEETGVEEVTYRRDTDDDGIKEKMTDYRATIEYTYSHDGETYTDDQVYPGAATDTRFGTRSGATDLTDDYSAGQTVTVYVAADNPENSFLVNDVSLLDYVAFFLGGGAFAFGGLFTLFKGI